MKMRVLAAIISIAALALLFEGCKAHNMTLDETISSNDAQYASKAASAKSQLSSGNASESTKQIQVEISGNTMQNYSGSVAEAFTILIPFKNVGDKPINGFQITTNDFGGSNFSILSVSDNPTIKKGAIAQHFIWNNKNLQPGESYTAKFELQPINTQSKKARLYLQDIDGHSMLLGQTKDLAFITVDLSIK